MQSARRKNLRFMVAIPFVCTMLVLGLGFSFLTVSGQAMGGSAEFTNVQVQRMLGQMAIIVAATGLGAWMAGLALARSVTFSIQELTRQTQSIARGDLTRRAKVDPEGEFAGLAQALDEMARSINHFLLSGPQEAVVEFNAQGAAVFISDKAARLFGFTDFNALGRPYWEWPLDWERNEPLFRMLDQATSGAINEGRTMIALHSALDQVISTAIQASQLKGDLGELRGFRLTFESTVSLKEVKERIRQLNRLSAMDGLIQGMAHQVRNPLCSISGLAQLLSERVPGDSEEAEYINSILAETEAINEAMETMFDRSAPPLKQSLGVRELNRVLQSHELDSGDSKAFA